MMRNFFRRLAAPNMLMILSAAEGAILGAGLESCFGEGRYRLIMLLGALGGLGIGVLAKAGVEAWETGRRDRNRLVRIWALAAGPALAVFAVWFLFRVLPLIQEELKFRI